MAKFFFPSAFEFPFSLSCFLISVFLLLFFCSFMISIVCDPFSFLLLLYASRSVYFLLLSVFSFPSSVQFFILLSVFCKLLFFPFPVLVLSACSICALSHNKSFTHIGHRTGALSGQGLLDLISILVPEYLLQSEGDLLHSSTHSLPLLFEYLFTLPQRLTHNLFDL